MINTIGRRKTAVARLYLREDTKGAFVVNKRAAKQYFPHPSMLVNLYQPFEVLKSFAQDPETGTASASPVVSAANYSIQVRVQGGGLRAQAEAIRLALARALVVLDEDKKPIMRAHGFLTRDARMVERKKYGRRKARRRFQFSKR